MRILILPVIIFLLCSICSYSQPGTATGEDCFNAINIPLDYNCRNYPGTTVANPDPDGDPIPIPVKTGNPLYCNSAPTALASGGRYVWFKFRPTAANACVLLNITASITSPVNAQVATEIAYYKVKKNGSPPGTCPDSLQAGNTGGSMCFIDGKGIWAPQLPSNLAANTDYYVRIYTANGAGQTINISICGRQYSPPNDICTQAIPIGNSTRNPDGVLDDNVCATASTQETTALTPSWLCATSLQNTAWYTYTVQGNGSTSVQFSSVNCDSYNGQSNVYTQIGLFTVPGGNCLAGGSPFVPVQKSGGGVACTTITTALGTQVLNTQPLTAGTKVFVAIDGYDGANCQYIIQGISNIVPVPIYLKKFSVWKQETLNQVRWITVWEKNNSYFEIQRSRDGIIFETIGKVDGQINSGTETQYGFDDPNPPALAYYRLKQVDVDQNYTFSEIVEVRRNDLPAFNAVFANPVSNSSRITIIAENGGKVNMRVVDVAGRDLMTQIVNCDRGNNTILKDFSKLPAGTYYLVLTLNEKRIVKPFIKQ